MTTPPKSIARYEVLNRIGRGGMGSLYLARDPNIDRLVAIKLLNADLEQIEVRDRFAREARSAGALNHPNIVTIFDYGVVEGAPFIVMEYIRGETLAEVIKRRAALPLAQKLVLLEQLCRGLGYAHHAGIIHRDIKPANLMIDQHGVLKILDFGIARLTDSTTSSSSVIGTPGYMSPEQIEGHHIHRQSDLFAVGAVAYELLTFAQAFAGGSHLATIHKVLHAEPTPVLLLAPEVGPEVVAIVDRALSKTVEGRYQDAASVLRDLQAARHALPTARPEPTTEVQPPGFAPVQPDASQAGDDRIERAHRAASEGDYFRARDMLDEVLASDAGHTVALALKDQIAKVLAADRVGDLLQSARAGLADNRLTEAGELISRVLAVQPKSNAARELRSQLDVRRLELRLQSAGTSKTSIAIAWGRWYFDQKAWGAARRSADEAMALDPNNAEAIALRDAADAGGAPADVPRPQPSPVAPISGSLEDALGRGSTVTRRAPRKALFWILAGIVLVLALVANSVWNRPRVSGPLPSPPPAPDRTPPTVALAAPLGGTTVSGDVSISVTASDNVGVVGVQVKVDGQSIGPELTSSPFRAIWQSTLLPDAKHTISVIARDAAENVATESVDVTVRNAKAPPPLPVGGTNSDSAQRAANAAKIEADQLKKTKDTALQDGRELAKKKDYKNALAALDKALANEKLKNDPDLTTLRSTIQGLADVAKKGGGGGK